jgi:hypothetical protein
MWNPEIHFLSCYIVNEEGALTQPSAGSVQAVLEQCVREGNREKYEWDESGMIDGELELETVFWTRFTWEVLGQLEPPNEEHLRELLSGAVKWVKDTGTIPLRHTMMFWTSIGRVRLAPVSSSSGGAAEYYDVCPIDQVDEPLRLRSMAPVAMGRELYPKDSGEFYAAVMEIPEMMMELWTGDPSVEFEAVYAILILVNHELGFKRHALVSQNGPSVSQSRALLCWSKANKDGRVVMRMVLTVPQWKEIKAGWIGCM